MRILILLGLLLVLLYLVLSGGGVALFKVIGDPTMSIIMTLYVITWVALLRLVIWAVRYKWRAPATTNTDEVALREINRMLENMEHRIESMETILLEREALSKGTRQMIDNYEQLNNQGTPEPPHAQTDPAGPDRCADFSGARLGRKTFLHV